MELSAMQWQCRVLSVCFALAVGTGCASSATSSKRSERPKAESLVLDADRDWVVQVGDGTAVDTVIPVEGATIRLLCVRGPDGFLARTGKDGKAQVGGASDLILGGCTLIVKADGYQRVEFKRDTFCPAYQPPNPEGRDAEPPKPPKDICPAILLDATVLRVGKFDAQDSEAIAQVLMDECFSGDGFKKTWKQEDKPAVRVDPNLVNKTMTHLDGPQIIATMSRALSETGRVRVLGDGVDGSAIDLSVKLTMSEDSEAGSKGAISRYHASWQVTDAENNVVCLSTPSRRKVTQPARMRKVTW